MIKRVCTRLLFVSIFAQCAPAQDIPALIRTTKPKVIAVLFISSQKLPDEAQLPVIGTHSKPSGEVDGYVYISGTGFFVSSDGYILTAQHVIADIPTPIKILLADGKILDAQVVASSSSSEHDFALLKANVSNIPFLTFEPFGSLSEGDDVIYMGHPFGLQPVITNKAMISWAGPSEAGDAFQLNGIVNSGESGGPLIDPKSGNAVGIVKAKYGALTPYLKMISDGKLQMGVNIGGGNFDLQHFVKDVASMMELHIQMGIGYAISTEYAETQLKNVTRPAPNPTK